MFKNVSHSSNALKMKGVFALHFIVVGGQRATILKREVSNLIILLPLGIQ